MNSLLRPSLARSCIQIQHPLGQLRFATKKAGGSTNNGRDSAGRRLGVKIFAGRDATPGAIIIRQRGKKFYAGENVGMGKDHTIYSKIEGTVYMTKNHKKSNVVHVRPLEDLLETSSSPQIS